MKKQKLRKKNQHRWKTVLSKAMSSNKAFVKFLTQSSQLKIPN